jgi:hypothetical protein
MIAISSSLFWDSPHEHTAPAIASQALNRTRATTGRGCPTVEGKTNLQIPVAIMVSFCSLTCCDSQPTFLQESAMDDELDLPPAKTESGPRKKRKRGAGEIRPPISIPDPEGAHKKFLAIMIGLFLLALTLMLVFHEYLDFAVDGGM